jgi:hypothetical protein
MNDIHIYSIQTYEKSKETLAKKKKKNMNKNVRCNILVGG